MSTKHVEGKWLICNKVKIFGDHRHLFISPIFRHFFCFFYGENGDDPPDIKYLLYNYLRISPELAMSPKIVKGGG